MKGWKKNSSVLEPTSSAFSENEVQRQEQAETAANEIHEIITEFVFFVGF
jgi:hypothetical protein